MREYDTYMLQQMGIDVWMPIVDQSLVNQNISIPCKHPSCALYFKNPPPKLISIFLTGEPSLFSEKYESCYRKFLRGISAFINVSKEHAITIPISSADDSGSKICKIALQYFLQIYHNRACCILLTDNSSMSSTQAQTYLYEHNYFLCTFEYDKLMQCAKEKKDLMNAIAHLRSDEKVHL